MTVTHTNEILITGICLIRPIEFEVNITFKSNYGPHLLNDHKNYENDVLKELNNVVNKSSYWCNCRILV